LSEPRREDAAETRAKPKLNGEQRRFFDILCDAIADEGDALTVSATVPPNVRGVTREHFKKCLQDRGFLDAEKPDSARALFSKYVNQLSGRKIVGTDKTYIWLAM
jgi:hypothetical protein